MFFVKIKKNGGVGSCWGGGGDGSGWVGGSGLGVRLDVNREVKFL